MDEKQLDLKIANIERGAYWFGIIGRLSTLAGMLLLISSALVVWHSYPSLNLDKVQVQFIGSSISYLLYGWLFLLGRDTFEAIVFSIKEIKETI